MANDHSTDEVIQFLQHAGERGMIPAATAQALAVASRNVFGILSDSEKADVQALKLDEVIKRFTNKRAKDFNPGSLKEYGRRTKRAVDLFLAWRQDPSNFNVKTRATTPRAPTKRMTAQADSKPPERQVSGDDLQSIRAVRSTTGYETTVPVRAGHLVTITNIPADLTKAEADKLAGLIRIARCRVGDAYQCPLANRSRLKRRNSKCPEGRSYPQREGPELRRDAEQLALMPAFEQLITLDMNRIEELPHQIRVAAAGASSPNAWPRNSCG